MPWGYAIAAAGSVAGGAIASSGSRKAAKAQTRAVNQAGQLEDARYRTNQAMLRPFAESAYGALGAINQQLGLPAVATPDLGAMENEYQVPRTGKATEYDVQQAYQKYRGRAPTERELKYYTGRLRADQLYNDIVGPNLGKNKGQEFIGGSKTNPTTMDRFAGFTETPGYQFALDQGLQAQERSAAARGRRFSGASLKEATRYAAGMASQEYDNYFRRLQSLAGLGQTSATNTATLGARSAENQGSLALASGMTRASGIANRSDIWADAATDIGGILGDWWSSRESGGGNGYDPSGFTDTYYGQTGR